MREIHPLIRIGGPILGALILYYVISTMVNQFQTDLEAMRRADAVIEDVVVMEPETAANTEEATSADGEGAAAAEGAETTEQAAETDPETTQTEAGDTEAGAPAETEPAGDEVTAETPLETDAAAEAAPAETTEAETTATEPTETETAATQDAATPATQPEDEAAGQAGADATPAETEEPAVVESEAEAAAETPEATSDAATEAIYAGLPGEISAFFPDEADPGQGQQLSVSTGCTACHSLQEGVVQVGPSWYNVAGHAASRVEGQSPALYLYTSIVEPNAYINEGFLPNLMPQNYPDILSDEQIAHIIAYLLTLHGEE